MSAAWAGRRSWCCLLHSEGTFPDDDSSFMTSFGFGGVARLTQDMTRCKMPGGQASERISARDLCGLPSPELDVPCKELSGRANVRWTYLPGIPRQDTA